MAKRKLQDVEKAYAAGFFDGEGSVQIGRPRATKPHYSLRVTAASTNVEAMTLLRDWWGGSVYAKPTPPGKNHKPSWHWQLAATQAADFLQELLPYLRLKKKQAEVGIQFQATSKRWGAVARWHGKPSDVIVRQHALWAELKQLNHRGLKPLVIEPVPTYEKPEQA